MEITKTKRYKTNEASIYQNISVLKSKCNFKVFETVSINTRLHITRNFLYVSFNYFQFI